MKKTIKEKTLQIRDFVLARGKIVFPILLIAAVAITVTIALRASSDKVEAAENPETVETTVPEEIVAEQEVPDVPLELNAYPEVNNLILTYYNAMADGDAETIASIQSSMDDMERIKIEEMGKYIESYPAVEVYTKPGPEEGSYIVIAYTKVIMSYYPEDYFPGYASFYVCTNEDGSLYINQESVPEEISEYIRKVILQDDVVELCNKIEVEYKDFCNEKPELLKYISEVEQEVKTSAGVILAQQINEETGETGTEEGTDTGEAAGAQGAEGTTETPEVTTTAETGPVYATTTTTVNVRSSDSETADKINKVPGGTKVEVLEQKVNGWSKIVYEGKEGFIKSEYLNVVESANGVETIGTVTATTNINVRAAASETAEKLGVAIGGDTLDLVANEGDWCKIIYNGQIGYVKAEYVQ
ncbi:MAG: SH3 domain-containing protein [Lachnospiraceae bacterium]